MSIPDLLQISEIRSYIQKRTGVVVKKWTIKRWIKNKQIDSFKLSKSGKRVTTKRAVDKFIRRYTREEIIGSEKQGYKILLANYKKLKNN